LDDEFVIGTPTEWREVENYADNCSGYKNISHHGENSTTNFLGSK
jgi:hypothetical protein